MAVLANRRFLRPWECQYIGLHCQEALLLRLANPRDVWQPERHLVGRNPTKLAVSREKTRNALETLELTRTSLFVSVAVAVLARLTQCAGKSTDCTPCYTVLSGTWLIGLSLHYPVEGRTNWCTVLHGWLPGTPSDVSAHICPYARLMAIAVLP